MDNTLKGLIVGVANEHSIAYGCARILKQKGADLALTYQNEKAKPFVAPLAEKLQASMFLPLDVTKPEEQQALFEAISQTWGRLDFLIHSIAFAPKADLHGRVLDSSAAGFAVAMDVSCHSLVRLARAAETLMTQGGSIVTMSYYGAEKVVPNYHIMGPVKAALEAVVRELSTELGPKKIRINALSPGPIKTRAASGLAHFDALMEKAASIAPLHQLVTIDDVGHMAAFLVSPSAAAMTGQVIYVDAGYHAVA
ncbi:MAG: enoyl-[acyl-carrier-protein] reductase FabI [Alphaproteobacteria bacterium]|nr:enoyl-[acyl-carrier-protein] reductase FabI [Alphaproteobacteria bacterium]